MGSSRRVEPVGDERMPLHNSTAADNRAQPEGNAPRLVELHDVARGAIAKRAPACNQHSTAEVYSSRPRHREMTGEGSRPGSGYPLKQLQTMHRLHKQGRVNRKRTLIGRQTNKRALKEDSGRRCVPRGSREEAPEAERFLRPLRARLTTRLAVRSSIRCTPSCCVDEGYL